MNSHVRHQEEKDGGEVGVSGPAVTVAGAHQPRHAAKSLFSSSAAEMKAEPHDQKEHRSIGDGEKDPGADAVVPEEVGHAHQGKRAEERSREGHQAEQHANIGSSQDVVIRAPGLPQGTESEKSQHGQPENAKYP
ncbi:hypothetical protein ES703_107492 [subsurface metagenome]